MIASDRGVRFVRDLQRVARAVGDVAGHLGGVLCGQAQLVDGRRGLGDCGRLEARALGVPVHRREDVGRRSADVLHARLDVTRDLRESADHRVEALGQALEVGAAVGVDRCAKIAIRDLGRELGVAADRGLERLARVTLDLGRVRELAVAFLGERAQAHQRQPEANPRGHERCGREAESDLVDVVERPDEQDQERQAGGHARDCESGARFLEL